MKLAMLRLAALTPSVERSEVNLAMLRLAVTPSVERSESGYAEISTDSQCGEK